ncbi:CotH kinase family protein [Emticicia sp. BO119]|uniref:CotH kinase family protein n=1 Tax=Emticicia sp. BO119 TaxID=2757768 RepID=UPI0015F0663F|nr:CotH kinase family protein [Emticicia sp. BO119]MBA4851617.1 CotH kinase family protein [Emticicia sp. BO119]
MAACRLNKFYKLLVLASLSVVVIISCSKEDIITPIKSAVPNDALPNIKVRGNENYLKQTSDYIYDQEKIKTFELIIPRDDLAKIDDNPTLEEYVEGALVFEGDTISPVGVRYKGSVGAFAGCLSDPDWGHPAGRKVCEKLSMQIKINWNGRKERFFDLNKLQFHAQNYDKSQLRERLAYWLFGQMGVPSPRTVHARLIINKKYSGLYGLVEEIDNRFAEYFYTEGKGNIYKEVWPIKPTGEIQPDKAFIDALKTNEEEQNISLIKEFGQAIVASNSSNTKDVVRKYMQINELLSYIVVDRAIRHDDGPFHWYCSDETVNSCFNHNYYWFEDKKNKRMHLIPWDMDGAFEQVLLTSNPYTGMADKLGEISNNCMPFNFGAGRRQRSASCDKLTAAWLSFGQEYNSIKNDFLNNFIKNDKILFQLDTWAKQIEPFIIEADAIHNKGIERETSKKTTTVIVWENARNALRSQVKGIL